ncbi:hypothetical protein C8J56DRAFT_153894 [Mycena floridula]|nr:hypothetical protein C8J56DRAFT_153894 [Mycena floridula]
MKKSNLLLKAFGSNAEAVNYHSARNIILNLTEKHLPKALSGYKTWPQYPASSKEAFFTELFQTPGLEMLSKDCRSDLTLYMSTYLGNLHTKRNMTLKKREPAAALTQNPEEPVPTPKATDPHVIEPLKPSPDDIREFLASCNLEHLTSALMKTGCHNMKNITIMCRWDGQKIKQFLSRNMSATPMEIEIIGDCFVDLGKEMKKLEDVKCS